MRFAKQPFSEKEKFIIDGSSYKGEADKENIINDVTEVIKPEERLSILDTGLQDAKE